MYLTWQLINIAIVILIIFFGIKFLINYKKHKIKTVSYTVVTVALLLISNFVGEKNKKETFVLNETNTETTKTSSVSLIDETLFDLNANISFSTNATKMIPKEVISKFTGFSYGFDWELKSAKVLKNEDNTVTYTLTGNLDWNLFDLTFYTQEKEFTGTSAIEE